MDTCKPGFILLTIYNIIYNTRLTRKALSIAGDPTHPTHNFFSLLPSGRRLRSLQARTNRLKDSFIHQAVRKLNSLPSLPPLPSLTPRITELGPPPHHPHSHTLTHTHTHTHTETSTGHLYSIGLTSFIQLPRLAVWIKKTAPVTLNSLINSLHYTIYILHCLFVCLSHWFALSAMCPMPLYPFFLYYYFYFLYLMFYFFPTCPYLYICNSCIFVYVCVYVCACMYVCMYIYIYICMCICVCMCMYVCVYVYIYMCICMYICIYMYMYVCIYMYIYIYIYIYIYMYIYWFVLICILAFYCLCLVLSVCTRE